MTTKKKKEAAKPARENPMPKALFKRVDASISEVENGFEVEIKWGWSTNTSDAETNNYRDYVAKTEAEALALITEIVPKLVEDDEPTDED